MNEATQHVLIIEDDKGVRDALGFAIPLWARPSPVLVHMISTMQEAENIIANPSLEFKAIAVDGNLWSGSARESLHLFPLLLEKFPDTILIAMSADERARESAVMISPKRILWIEKGDVATKIIDILTHRS